MKYIFIACLMMSTFISTSFAQVEADPGYSGFDVTDLNDVSLDANQLPLNGVVKLKLPFFNSSPNTIPAQTLRVRIGCGTRMIIDPAFNLATAPYNNYFAWTVIVGSQPQIIGDLIADLPGNFDGTFVFQIKGNATGSSTFSANMVLNPITGFPTTLSDEDPNNNTTTTSYTVVTVTPVNFTGLDVLKTGCNIKVNFKTALETNVDHYEIEASKDGSTFVKVAQVAATKAPQYKTDFAITSLTRATNLFVRVKAVDKDGNIQYSDINKVSGICEKALSMSLYPNPVTDSRSIVVTATEGLFNGKYKVSMLDMTGRLISTKQVELTNAGHFNFDGGNLPSGKFLLKVMNLEGTESATLTFQKM